MDSLFSDQYKFVEDLLDEPAAAAPVVVKCREEPAWDTMEPRGTMIQPLTPLEPSEMYIRTTTSPTCSFIPENIEIDHSRLPLRMSMAKADFSNKFQLVIPEKPYEPIVSPVPLDYARQKMMSRVIATEGLKFIGPVETRPLTGVFPEDVKRCDLYGFGMAYCRFVKSAKSLRLQLYYDKTTAMLALSKGEETPLNYIIVGAGFKFYYYLSKGRLVVHGLVGM
jgi:hypothetical protein